MSRCGPSIRRVPRLLLAAIGVLLVAVAAVGVFVPGLPTTPFLLLAVWCFARSMPALERRLLRNRFFAPYMRFVDGEALPPRIKVAAIITVWACVSISAALLVAVDRAAPWLVAVIIAGAALGTVVILRRGRSRAAHRIMPLTCGE